MFSLMWLSKVRKSAYNIKRHFKQFFTFLERTSTFIISLFRAIYRSSYPDVFTRKAFCYRYVTYLQRNTHAELLRGCSTLNCLNIRRTPPWKTPLCHCFCIYENEYNMCLPAFTCSELKQKNYKVQS